MSFSNKDQANGMLANLDTIKSLYRDKYLTLGSSMGIYGTQKAKLQDTVNSLNTKLNLKNGAISTYQREYLDRKTIEMPFTFWRLRGVSTLQDWVLFVFFAIYGIFCITFLLITFTTEYMLYNFVLVLIASITIGTMIVATIVRFA